MPMFQIGNDLARAPTRMGPPHIHNPLACLLGDRPCLAMWGPAQLLQPNFTLRYAAPQPLVDGLPAHSILAGQLGDALLFFQTPLNKFLSLFQFTGLFPRHLYLL